MVFYKKFILKAKSSVLYFPSPRFRGEGVRGASDNTFGNDYKY
jgi:hypothetical protein